MPWPNIAPNLFVGKFSTLPHGTLNFLAPKDTDAGGGGEEQRWRNRNLLRPLDSDLGESRLSAQDGGSIDLNL